MVRRWIQLIQKSVPTVDLVDISNEVKPHFVFKSQFAAVYSQAAYNTEL